MARTTFSVIAKVLSNLTFPWTQNTGIQLDWGTTTFGWADLKGTVVTANSGANAPTREEYKTGVFWLGYNTSDVQDWSFHLEHSEIIGGDKYIHPHIRHNGTGITWNLVLTIIIAHNYGHNRAWSPAPITKTITVTPSNIPQYQTYIPDILIMQTGGGAGLLNSSNILPDDDIIVSMTVTTLPSITGGLSSKVFIPFLDLHREVNGILWTKNKDPSGGSFYV